MTRQRGSAERLGEAVEPKSVGCFSIVEDEEHIAIGLQDLRDLVPGDARCAAATREDRPIAGEDHAAAWLGGIIRDRRGRAEVADIRPYDTVPGFNHGQIALTETRGEG